MNELVTRYGAWALVAGASEGLGAAWADALAARGLNLVLVARRAEVLAQTARALEARHGVQAVTAALDLSAPRPMDTLGPLLAGRDVGVVVFNAAFAPLGPFLERPAEDQLRCVDVSCRAQVEIVHALARPMVERGRGAIILMSSLTAFQGSPWLSTYGAAKAFTLTLAEGLHEELGPRGVHVLACCAGATRTPGYLKSATKPAPGELEPAQVVEATLAALGRRAVVVPGAFNRFAQAVLSLLPRSVGVRLLGQQTRALKP